MGFERITSVKNEGIAKVLQLRDRKGRNAQGLTLIDGVREITAAVKAHVELQRVYVCPERLEAKALEDFLNVIKGCGATVIETSAAVFEKIAFGDREEGVVAVAKPPLRNMADVRLRANPLVVVVEQVEKPGNLGAILRTCDAAGVDAVLVCDPRTDLYNPNVIRSSLGAVFTVVSAVGNNDEVKDFLKKNKIKTVGTFPEASIPYDQHNFTLGCAIVLGSEQAGLSAFWQDNSDDKIQIPMHGEVNSLNVAATAAIVIYEACRQRAR